MNGTRRCSSCRAGSVLQGRAQGGGLLLAAGRPRSRTQSMPCPGLQAAPQRLLLASLYSSQGPVKGGPSRVSPVAGVALPVVLQGGAAVLGAQPVPRHEARGGVEPLLILVAVIPAQQVVLRRSWAGSRAAAGTRQRRQHNLVWHCLPDERACSSAFPVLSFAAACRRPPAVQHKVQAVHAGQQVVHVEVAKGPARWTLEAQGQGVCRGAGKWVAGTATGKSLDRRFWAGRACRAAAHAWLLEGHGSLFRANGGRAA